MHSDMFFEKDIANNVILFSFFFNIEFLRMLSFLLNVKKTEKKKKKLTVGFLEDHVGSGQRCSGHPKLEKSPLHASLPKD